MNPFILSALIYTVFSAPFDHPKYINDDYKTQVEIHQSCNSTQSIQLGKALEDANKFTENARDYLLRAGVEDDLVKKYFGTDLEPSNSAIAAGIFDSLERGDKAGAILRCDDPDQMCATHSNYAGHWRGSNGTLETVICPLSYSTRIPIENVCALGHVTSDSSTSKFWGIDLIHRFSHLPVIAGGSISHYAETLDESFELAKNNATKAPFNMKSIQYFAMDAWAKTFANPGKGCSTPEDLTEETPSPSQPNDNNDGSDGKDCHTHANGELHCV